jgi:hypothetical protein
VNSLSPATPADSTGLLEKKLGGTLQARLALAALGLLVLTIWILQRPYRGLFHDSILYTFLALARLHPQSLAHDLFLRFGSQDSFTVFSPIYAAAIRALDLEPAAAVLTFLGQAVFFVAAWCLARRVMPGRLALLAVGLLIALPSGYGAKHIFNYIEGFLTPRQFAEGFALASLAAILAGRRVLGVVFFCAGMLFHPIMALAAPVLVFCLYVVVPRPRLGIAIVAIATGAFLGVVMLMPFGPFRPFDAAWLEPINAFSDYLFVLGWHFSDWSQLCMPAAVLVIGFLTSSTPLVRKLCAAALIMSVCGLATTFIFCDALHVVIFTQVQPWRWLWLAQAIAVLFLPVIVPTCWRAGVLGRATILLLVSGWELRDLPAAPIVLVGAMVCAATAGRPTNARHGRLVVLGCGALLFISVLLNLLPHTLHTARHEDIVSFPERLSEWLNIWVGDGLLYCCALALVFWAGERRAVSSGLASVTVALGLICVFSPVGWHSWSTYQYTPSMRAAFTQWRSVIPAEAQLVWPGSPVAPWYLLERPVYWSLAQIAGDIFSRDKALEGARRSRWIQKALEDSGEAAPIKEGPPLPMGTEKLNASAMAEVCADPELSFVVSWSDLGPTAYPEVVPDLRRPENRLRLYRCADVRQATSTTPLASAPSL